MQKVFESGTCVEIADATGDGSEEDVGRIKISVGIPYVFIIYRCFHVNNAIYAESSDDKAQKPFGESDYFTICSFSKTDA